MKTKLLFAKQKSNAFYCLLVFCLCFNYGWSQELVKNGSCDDFIHASNETGPPIIVKNTDDNADAWDMTPNSTVIDNTGATIDSPYRFDTDDNPDGWKNDALEDALELKYLGVAGTLDEQPGSTSSGNGGTRGVKLYDDDSPNITGSSRRLYQRVVGLTIGNDYNFSIDSRSEASGTTSEVYILNTQISDEVGIDANGYSDTSVVTGMDITNDNPDWTTTDFTFTATTTEVVIYVRSLASIDEDTEVFYDNISLQEDATASVEDAFASNFKIYPNPAEDFITIESKNSSINSIEIFDLLGKSIYSKMKPSNNVIDVSDFSKGVYLLKLESEGKSLTKKIVIN